MLYWPPWQRLLWPNPGMLALHGLTFGYPSAFRPQQNVTAVIPCRKLKVNAPRLVQVVSHLEYTVYCNLQFVCTL